MTNLKRLFAYALVITGTFSLTAISCDDLTEDITVDVPTEITKVIRIASTERGYIEIIEPVDMGSDEFKEKRDQMEDFTLETIEFTVVDNLAGGSGVPTNTYMIFGVGLKTVNVPLVGTTMQAQLSITPDYVTQIKDAVETWLLSQKDETIMNITFSGTSGGPMDYTITLKMTATIEASAD